LFKVRCTAEHRISPSGSSLISLNTMNQLNSNKNSLVMKISPLRDEVTSQLTCCQEHIIIH